VDAASPFVVGTAFIALAGAAYFVLQGYQKHQAKEEQARWLAQAQAVADQNEQRIVAKYCMGDSTQPMTSCVKVVKDGGENAAKDWILRTKEYLSPRQAAVHDNVLICHYYVCDKGGVIQAVPETPNARRHRNGT
jgi:hypothetical protein